MGIVYIFRRVLNLNNLIPNLEKHWHLQNHSSETVATGSE